MPGPRCVSRNAIVGCPGTDVETTRDGTIPSPTHVASQKRHPLNRPFSNDSDLANSVAGHDTAPARRGRATR